MTDRFALIFTGALALFILPGCDKDTGDAEDSAAVCGSDWYEFIESSVSTGDGQGHGPDPGSEEWRSTVEFRLGILGLSEVPNRMTEEWCRFIDTQIHAQ